MSDVESSNGNGKELFPIFVDETTARVAGTRAQKAEVPKLTLDRESKMREINQKMRDPKVPESEIQQLLREERALTASELCTLSRVGSAPAELRNCFNYLNVVKALEKSFVKKPAVYDVLDFDGLKFEFVLGKLYHLFREAAYRALGPKNAGTDYSVKNIMNHFRMLYGEQEEELRRETAKIKSQADIPWRQPTLEKVVIDPPKPDHGETRNAKEPGDKQDNDPNPVKPEAKPNEGNDHRESADESVNATELEGKRTEIINDDESADERNGLEYKNKPLDKQTESDDETEREDEPECAAEDECNDEQGESPEDDGSEDKQNRPVDDFDIQPVPSRGFAENAEDYKLAEDTWNSILKYEREFEPEPPTDDSHEPGPDDREDGGAAGDEE